MNELHASTRSATRGSALLIALIAVTVVVSLGLGFLSITGSVSRRQSSDVETLQAFYLAEAGLAEAFHAVRIGRTGQIGSETAPATHGNGLVWVDAIETAGGDQVRLESTGMCGTGRASLALVVQPTEIPLGFFSDEDLVIDSVLLVDGFDSQEGGYQAQVGGAQITIDPSYPFLNIDDVENLVFYEGSFYRFFGVDGNTYTYDHAVSVERLSKSPEYGASSVYAIDPDDFIDGLDDFTDQEYDGVTAYFDSLTGDPALALTDDATPTEAIASALGPTTGGGGLLGSNGNVIFSTLNGEPVEVYGDVVPGPEGAVQGLEGVSVSGDSTSRSVLVELPAVEVPDVALAPALRHEGVLPLLVSPGTSGHARIEVAAGAELILRGPATVVIGQLIVEPGALLTLDTRDGDVALYVTAGTDLQQDSVVETTSDVPDELSLQVAEIPSNGVAPVQLNATSQFHGTIYAPDTEVEIGSDFEIFGGVVARKLEIGVGARLHFDNAGFDESPIPRIVAWRIVEVPTAVKGGRNPLRALGVTREELDSLTAAHDLQAVSLKVTYLNQSGAESTYDGTEDGFDWDLVAQVLSVARDPERTVEDGNGLPKDPDGPDGPAEPRDIIEDALEDMSGSQLKDFLISEAPLTEPELLAFIADDKMSRGLEKDVLMASSPLPESVLTALIENPDGAYDPDGGGWLNPDGIDRGMLADVLVANSPLPRSTLDAVEAAAATLLDNGDKARVLAAQ